MLHVASDEQNAGPTSVPKPARGGKKAKKPRVSRHLVITMLTSLVEQKLSHFVYFTLKNLYQFLGAGDKLERICQLVSICITKTCP